MMKPAILDRALEQYCEWLNQWTEASDGPEGHVYKPEQFYDSQLVAMIPMYDNLWIFSVYDGDDGGPTELYVWEKDGLPHVIAQGFDTMLQIIYDTDKDPNFLNTPS